MNNFDFAIPARFSRLRCAVGLLSISLSIPLLATTASAASPLPKNIDASLSSLIAEDFTAKGVASVLDADADAASTVTLSDAVIRDSQGRVMVDILLRNAEQRAAVLEFMQLHGNVEVKAEDMKYQGGILEALVPVEIVADLARHRGVSAIHSVVPPVTDVGAVTQQGVVQHRVDQIANQTVSPVTGITGAGITIGVLSDSFNTSPGATSPTGIGADDDVASGDLPGPGNVNNPNPVVVLEDLPAPAPPAANGNIDEGRAMCQLIHDMAPGANLAFATAFTGQVAFANNIRRLAAPVTGDPATTGAGCDIVVDDIIYFAEPMFSDGIIARAVDEVFAQGVPYFSSAGNRPAVQGYFSNYRNVPNGTGLTAAAGNTALAGTNINLSRVPPQLYAGGFQDFDPDAAQDVAQTVDIGSSATFAFQWDDPYDVNPVVVGEPFVSGTGTVPPAGMFDFTFSGNTDQRVQIDVFGSGSTPNFDAIVQVIAPDSTSVVTQDTGNGETLLLFLPQTGTYTVRVTEFTSGGTPGPGGQVDYSVATATGTLISTDFNLLAFRADGSFIGATGEDNINTNRPTEIPRITAVAAAGPGATSAQIQIVIARRNVPPATPQPASVVRYVTFTSGTVREYFSYTDTPVTFGHNSARGANGVAAYPFYPPFIPEGFTSPGFGYFAFDNDNNRLPEPEIRLKPDMAAMDGGNTTFFGGDAAQDPDTFPNFFGTSAAAPTAAAIGALVLEANGGPNSVTSTQLRTMLQRSAFPHDLDPYFARGQGRAAGNRVTITASADPNTSPNAFDFNIFGVSYVGRSSLTQLVFNPSGSEATSGNTTEPVVTTAGFTARPGLTFDNRAPTTGSGPFAVGSTRGVSAGDIMGILSNPAAPPAVEASQFYTLTVNVTAGMLTGGEGFNFGIDRDEVDAFGPANAVGGNSADLLGANIRIPEGSLAPGGMTFSGTLENGRTFSGTFRNRIGAGYSVLDGFGFVNAENAVAQPIP
ncbi:MAG: peptidase S53 [Verrucomicrobiota bacterium]|nr:peptidase S53 [Verrucomicrobiota bacterium]